ncbi:MAG: N-acetylmuramoyl-L-alanine amidase [Dialister sp.]|nr:N-acetylmuramoyl-L-alanine amidase [Dialister sp.]
MKQLIKICILLLSFFVLSLQWAGAADNEITGFRATARNDGDPPFMRIAMDLKRATHAEAALDDSGKNFELILKNTRSGTALGQYDDLDHRAIDFATVSEKDGDTYVEILFTKPQKIDDIRIFALKPDSKLQKPHRLVVDIPIIGAKQTYKKPTADTKKDTVSEKLEKPVKVGTVTIDERAKKALKGKVICIDPGHGGSDVGAIGHLKNKAIYEKDITLAIAKPLRDMLSAAGAQVVMTRTDDKDVYGPFSDATTELQARCDIANEAHAAVFISIHIDSIGNPEIDGTTTYYYAGSRNKNTLLFAQIMHQSTLSSLNIPDRGIRSNNFYVNVHTTMPSILVELGYITNQHRLEMLTSKWAPKTIAASLFNGFVNYFEQVR